jgi:trans-aconitate 2-methyltransferase
MSTWNASQYAQHSSQQQLWARELIGKLELVGHERILDIGCGDGKVSAELAAAVASDGSVLGVDNSMEMIRYARDHFAGISNLKFEIADASSLPFKHEFDVVFSNAALHWVVDHRPVLKGIAAALKPRGRALLQMGGEGNGAGVLASIEKVITSARWAAMFPPMPFPYGFHSPADYRTWLLEAGLEPVRVESIPKDMVHPDVDAFGGWIRTTWLPWTLRVPADQREHFIEEVVETYLRARPADADGHVHVAMVRLEVQAIKAPDRVGGG